MSRATGSTAVMRSRTSAITRSQRDRHLRRGLGICALLACAPTRVLLIGCRVGQSGTCANRLRTFGPSRPSGAGTSVPLDIILRPTSAQHRQMNVRTSGANERALSRRQSNSWNSGAKATQSPYCNNVHLKGNETHNVKLAGDTECHQDCEGGGRLCAVARAALGRGQGGGGGAGGGRAGAGAGRGRGQGARDGAGRASGTECQIYAICGASLRAEARTRPAGPP
jgi:hypothetical protein